MPAEAVTPAVVAHDDVVINKDRRVTFQDVTNQC